jgi:hypothetical protein
MDKDRAWLELQLLLLENGAVISPAIPATVDTDKILLERYEAEFNDE